MQKEVLFLRKSRLISLTAVLLFLIIMTSFGTILNFVTDYLWFKEVGYTQVFFKKLLTQLKIGIPIFLVVSILLYIYLRTIKKDYYKKVKVVTAGMDEKRINLIALVTSLGISFFTTLALSSNLWFEILRFFNSTEFNVTDPIFKQDLSFYIFRLPFITQIYNLLIMVIILLTLITLLFYFFLMSVRRPKLREISMDDEGGYGNIFQGGFDKNNGKELLHIAIRQLTVLGVLFFIVLAAGYFIKQYDLLYSPRGVAFGASYTDVHVTLWVYRIMMVLGVVSAILFAVGIRTQKFRLAFAGPVLMIIVSILGNGAALAVQNFVVAPDEISKESEYLEYNIDYTKKAYGLDQIEEQLFPAELDLTKEDLDNNLETIENIRINDYRPTKQFYNQRQGIRLYYKFNDVDVDRYMVNDKYTQVFLSVREIDETQLNVQWINQHLKYTHGYGLTLSPVNTVTSTGQPKLLIESIPPESQVKEITIDRPEIYYGELTNNYIITNTDEAEFDYPSGESNVETFYEGTGGIRLNGLNRLLFSIKEQSLKMLISNNISSDSKILLYRNINERVRKIAPFITFDKDPYVVVNEGKLYWVIDGYTMSSNYPYAEPYMDERTNYIRNSVKVTIDTYNGDTNFYVVDEEDPVISTLGKIFPELLKPISEMPEGIKTHLRYPQVLFDIQAYVYRDYHMTDITVFYQGEDKWDIANEIYEQEVIPMESSYTIMKLPGLEKEEFILSIPYTPKNKPNMTALFVARNDGEDYGKLVIYKLPKKKAIYGPMQIESKIDQDTTISKEFSLWGQRGSSYIRGNLLTIPIENSLIYVEPIYLKADNENSLPEVKRVIVAYGDRIAYQPTLKEALEELFGKTAVPAPEGEGGAVPTPGEDGVINMDDLIRLANEAFNNAQEAQKNGDWSAYGRYLRDLESYLQRLEESNQTVY